MRIVQKYGGSSVATVEQILQIAKHTKKLVQNNDKIIIVVSAMGKTTNELIAIANECAKNPNKRDLDFLLNVGEMKSVALLSIALNDLGVSSTCLTGWQAGIETDDSFGKCFIKKINISQIEKLLKKHNVVVVAGFQGVCGGELTTLGRGGSDTTAVALAAALNARCEIYTDVDGVYFADPRHFDGVTKADKISYDEMLNLAICGAKVLDVRCLEIAKKYGVPVYLDKTLNKDENGGTLVVSKTNYYESLKISGVASLSGFVLVKCVTKQKTDVFNVLKTFSNTIDFFECNGEQINFVCKQSDWEGVKKVFVRNKIKFQTKFDLSKLTIAGAGFSTHEGAVLKILQLFEENDINFEHFYVSETAIYVILETEKQEKAVSVLIEIFNNKE